MKIMPSLVLFCLSLASAAGAFAFGETPPSLICYNRAATEQVSTSTLDGKPALKHTSVLSLRYRHDDDESYGFYVSYKVKDLESGKVYTSDHHIYDYYKCTSFVDPLYSKKREVTIRCANTQVRNHRAGPDSISFQYPIGGKITQVKSDLLDETLPNSVSNTFDCQSGDKKDFESLSL